MSLFGLVGGSHKTLRAKKNTPVGSKVRVAARARRAAAASRGAGAAAQRRRRMQRAAVPLLLQR